MRSVPFLNFFAASANQELQRAFQHSLARCAGGEEEVVALFKRVRKIAAAYAANAACRDAHTGGGFQRRFPAGKRLAVDREAVGRIRADEAL